MTSLLSPAPGFPTLCDSTLIVATSSCSDVLKYKKKNAPPSLFFISVYGINGYKWGKIILDTFLVIHAPIIQLFIHHPIIHSLSELVKIYNYFLFSALLSIMFQSLLFSFNSLKSLYWAITIFFFILLYCSRNT